MKKDIMLKFGYALVMTMMTYIEKKNLYYLNSIRKYIKKLLGIPSYILKRGHI